MHSVQKMNISENEYAPVAVRVWKKTYDKLKAMSNTERSIVRLIDRGVKLLEKTEENET